MQKKLLLETCMPFALAFNHVHTAIFQLCNEFRIELGCRRVSQNELRYSETLPIQRSTSSRPSMTNSLLVFTTSDVFNCGHFLRSPEVGAFQNQHERISGASRLESSATYPRPPEAVRNPRTRPANPHRKERHTRR